MENRVANQSKKRKNFFFVHLPYIMHFQKIIRKVKKNLIQNEYFSNFKLHLTISCTFVITKVTIKKEKGRDEWKKCSKMNLYLQTTLLSQFYFIFIKSLHWQFQFIYFFYNTNFFCKDFQVLQCGRADLKIKILQFFIFTC